MAFHGAVWVSKPRTLPSGKVNFRVVGYPRRGVSQQKMLPYGSFTTARANPSKSEIKKLYEEALEYRGRALRIIREGGDPWIVLGGHEPPPQTPTSAPTPEQPQENEILTGPNFEQWIDNQHGVSDKTRRGMEAVVGRLKSTILEVGGEHRSLYSTPIAKLTPAHGPVILKAWVMGGETNGGKKLGPSSANAYFKMLSRANGSSGIRPNVLRDEEIKLHSTRNKVEKVPPHEHLLAYLKGLQGIYRLVAIVLALGGTRIEETLYVRKRDYMPDWRERYTDLTGDGRLCLNTHTKFGKQREIDVYPAFLLGVLDWLAEQRQPNETLLLGLPVGEASTKPKIAAFSHQLRRRMAAIGKEQKLDRMTPHGFRHWRGSLWINVYKYALSDVTAWLGHSNEQTTHAVYTHKGVREIPVATWLQLLREAFGGEGLEGVEYPERLVSRRWAVVTPLTQPDSGVNSVGAHMAAFGS